MTETLSICKYYESHFSTINCVVLIWCCPTTTVVLSTKKESSGQNKSATSQVC